MSGHYELFLLFSIIYKNLLFLLQSCNLIFQVFLNCFQTIDLYFKFVYLAGHLLDCVIILSFEFGLLNVDFFIVKLFLALYHNIFFLQLAIVKTLLFSHLILYIFIMLFDYFDLCILLSDLSRIIISY